MGKFSKKTQKNIPRNTKNKITSKNYNTTNKKLKI